MLKIIIMTMKFAHKSLLVMYLLMIVITNILAKFLILVQDHV